MDLWRLTREQLRRAGIPDERIYGIDLCTRSLADDFFSYRADRNCGRQASLIWLEGTGLIKRLIYNKNGMLEQKSLSFTLPLL